MHNAYIAPFPNINKLIYRAMNLLEVSLAITKENLNMI